MNRMQRVVAVLAVMGIATGGGVAIAVWSATGAGSGPARAVTAQPLVATAGVATADLFPGFTQGDLFFSVRNPNPYPVTITSFTPGAITTSAPACANTNITVAPAIGLAIVVPAGATAAAVTVANIVSMLLTAPDACQGVTFTIAVTLTDTQA